MMDECFAKFPSAILEGNFIQNYINGKQNFEKGRALVACGFVHQVKVEKKEKVWIGTGYVHAQMAANKWYLVSSHFDELSLLETKCVCLAGKNTHNKCKHISALLHAIYLIMIRPTIPPKYISDRWNKVKRFYDPGSDLHQRIKVDLTYQQILLGFDLPPPRHHTGAKAKLIDKAPKTQQEKTKEKKEKEQEKIEKEVKKRVAIEVAKDKRQREEVMCVSQSGSVQDAQDAVCVSQSGSVQGAMCVSQSGSVQGAICVSQSGSVQDAVCVSQRVSSRSMKQKRKQAIWNADIPKYKTKRAKVEYPPEIAVLCESERENWRLTQIYQNNKK
jgi:hypothetical protein